MVLHLVCSGKFHSFDPSPRDRKWKLDRHPCGAASCARATSCDDYLQTGRWISFLLNPSKLDNNIASMFSRSQIIKRRKRVFECESFLVHNRLQVHFVLFEEIAKVLLILSRSNTDTPSAQLARRTRNTAEKHLSQTYCIFANFIISGMTQSGKSF